MGKLKTGAGEGLWYSELRLEPDCLQSVPASGPLMCMRRVASGEGSSPLFSLKTKDKPLGKRECSIPSVQGPGEQHPPPPGHPQGPAGPQAVAHLFTLFTLPLHPAALCELSIKIPMAHLETEAQRSQMVCKMQDP